MSFFKRYLIPFGMILVPAWAAPFIGEAFMFPVIVTIFTGLVLAVTIATK